MSDPTLITVPLGPRTYSIAIAQDNPEDFGEFTRTSLDQTWAGRDCRRGLIVTDSNVAPLVSSFADSLEKVGIATTLAVVPAGEASKSISQAETLYDVLVADRANRHHALFAIGGGVIGDLAGFVAATYTRGLPYIMVPTTVLAQVDSSVGGKVGVNHPKAKNIIGAFHQPAGVWIDSRTLRTLPLRELRCGLAEVVKYGMILDAGFHEWLETHVVEILDRDGSAIRRIQGRCCQLKAEVVTQDEREETGLRAILNFGHTIGHAIEAVSGYGGQFQHGEAVAVGMVAECRLAERLGWIDAEVTDRVRDLLAAFGLPTTAPGLDQDELLEAMTRDKKNRDARIGFILPRRIGAVEAIAIDDRDLVRSVIATWDEEQA